MIFGSCAALLFIHALSGFLPNRIDNQIEAYLAVLPVRFALALHIEPDRVAAAYRATVDGSPVAARDIAFLIGDGGTRWWTLFTNALLHASWAHVGFNCLWLVVFGGPVALRLATVRFLALFVVSVLLANLVYIACDLTSFDLVIGASGGISGVVGALSRFIFRPADEPPGALDKSYVRRPALTLRQMLTTPAPLVFTLVFLAANALANDLPSFGAFPSGSIAWQGHIGGYLAGLLLFPLFDGTRSEAPNEDDRVA